MNFYNGKTAHEELTDIVARMHNANGEVLCTVRLSTVRHAAIMLDKEVSCGQGENDQAGGITDTGKGR